MVVMAMMAIPKSCWICGDIATTGEHLLKKTDVITVFGDKFSKRVVRTDLYGNDKILVQSPNSKALKFQNNLCAKCNNERTQPYDRAYVMFANYIRSNLREITRKLEINTNLVFGKRNAKEQQKYLFRYFVKAFGCRLHDAGQSVPQVLKDILIRENYGNTYRVSVCLNSEKLDGLSIFPLEGDRNACGIPIDYYWAQDNGWFTIVHAYNRQVPYKYGDEWFGKSKKVVVGKWSDLP